MRPTLSYYPAVENKNAACFPDGRKPVGDSNGDPITRRRRIHQCPLNDTLRLGIQRARRLVQQDHGRPRDQGAGNCDSLPLPTGQLAAARPAAGAEALRQRADEVSGVGGAAGLLDLSIVGRGRGRVDPL